MSWREKVTDPDEIKVFEALDEPTDTWRTLPAIARQTRLPQDKVLEILTKYNLKLTMLSEVPSISGQPLAALLEKVDDSS